MMVSGTLKLKVAPGAAKDEVVGWLGDALKLRVRAAPEKGRANAAVVSLLADVLRVAKSRIVIVAGAGSRRKLVRVNGLTSEEVRERIRAGRGP